jgi:hypothetical protein
VKKIEHVANIQLSRQQIKPLKAVFAKMRSMADSGKPMGSVAAQIFYDGSARVAYLTPRQVAEWQKYVGNTGIKRITASGAAFRRK